jgi:NADPH:quinone reductase-like Zn-dependent oxidoreductase
MRVAWVARYGAPDVVEFRDVPTPEPRAGEVRIRVLATAVSTGDWRIRSGIMPRGFGPLRGLALGFGGPRRAVLGTDAAGVVDAVGAGVTRFHVGDAVLAFPGSSLGGHAEFLVLPEDGRVVAKPANLTFEEAAALPFGSLTALDFLTRGAVKAGERVLVNGASGAVGVATVQLAKARGAHVTAVCSGANAELVRGLGADEVIDYTSTDFAADHPDAWDVIVDTVGNAPYARVTACLAPGGRLLIVLGDLSAILMAPFIGGAKGHRVVAGPSSERVQDLEAVARLASDGALRPAIDRRFGFDAIVDAHRVVETGHKRGSVVVALDGRAATR